MLLLFGLIVVTLTHGNASAIIYIAMDVGNPTGNMIANQTSRSKLSCAADCLSLQSEIFSYVDPICSCFDGSSAGATFVAPGGTSVLYGMAQVLNSINSINSMQFVK